VHTKTTRQSDPAPSMTTSMKAIAAIELMLKSTEALAQSRTFYGADGRVTGRSITGSSGATTIYGADGRVTGRTFHKRQPDDDLRQRWAPRRHCHDNQTTGQMT
jgi:hypothetical protein